ncbi:MAG: hypothetical protein H7210_09700, partial [Pyrinomonadaceae bacterium]|nr:hypothetical protein [Phycisphaerales bacterium]
MVRNNGKVSKSASAARTQGHHAAQAVAAEIESIGDRATKLVHQAIEEVTDSLQAGKDSILDTTKHAKEVTEEKISAHPLAAIGEGVCADLDVC